MSTQTEYEAAASSAVLFPVINGARFRMLGPDSQEYLHRMVSNDFLSLTSGQSAWACVLAIDGRLIADLYAWILDEETILVETSADTLAPLMSTLEKYIIMERIELEDATGALDLVTVLGPGAPEIVTKVLDIEANDMPEGHCLPKDDMIIAARPRGWVGSLDIYAPPQRMPAIRQALIAGGCHDGSPETLDILRVESGIPTWGAELTTRTIPLEANLDGKAVSFTKGCYPGQEVIARIHSRGRPAKELRGIRLEGTVLPAPGNAVLHDGTDIGIITSAVNSPRFSVIALAYLDKNHLDPDQPVTVGGVPGVTSLLPF